MNRCTIIGRLGSALLLAVILVGCQREAEQPAPPAQTFKKSGTHPLKAPKTAANTAVTSSGDRQAGMRRMRMLDLTNPPATWGFKKDKEFPKIYGVLVDEPLQGNTITIISMRDGTASLYTTGSFGVIGAGSHAPVHDAAIKLVEAAETRWDAAKPTKNFDYPTGDQAHFFLLGYDGVRVIEGKMSDLVSGKGESALFLTTENVMTQIRLAADGRRPGE